VLDLPDAIARLTSGPAKILDLPFGQLAVGASADICIFDPQQRWTVRSDQLLSQGKNSPFIGWDLPGRVSHTLLEGRIVYTAEPA
jgi:dihydroorotase